MARAARLRICPEETRGRILATAEEQFRRVGYAKTTVADIAAALGMSPANVYRFFPSKSAINEALCERVIREEEDLAWSVARMKVSAAERLERLALEVHNFNKANLVNERRIHEMVAVAFEEHWDAIKAHIARKGLIIEAVIRDGVAAGEFVTDDPVKAALCVKTAFMPFWHPQLIAECQDDIDEARIREMARFVVRALSPTG